jgi:hypothetical protein
VAARAADGTDTVDVVSRVVLSCPGQHWCHRGGCHNATQPEITALLTPIVAAANAAEAASEAANGDVSESFQEFYGDGDGPDWNDVILDQVVAMLSDDGWVELERSEWEGGLEESLLRRGEHCLTVRYDPVTRQIEFAEGRSELDLTLQLLADDGLLSGDEEGLSRSLCKSI